jgi:hypothetical protein
MKSVISTAIALVLGVAVPLAARDADPVGITPASSPSWYTP